MSDWKPFKNCPLYEGPSHKPIGPRSFRHFRPGLHGWICETPNSEGHYIWCIRDESRPGTEKYISGASPETKVAKEQAEGVANKVLSDPALVIHDVPWQPCPDYNA